MKIENTFKFYLQFCIPFPSKPFVLALKSNDEIDSSACFETHVHFYTDMPLRMLRNYTGGLNNFVQNTVGVEGLLGLREVNYHLFAFVTSLFSLDHFSNSSTAYWIRE